MNLLESYNFFFELPLYTEIQINQANKNELLKLYRFSGKIDAYNPSIKQESTFIVTPPTYFNQPYNLYNLQGFQEFNLKCVRNDYKIKIIVFLYNDAKEDEYEDVINYKLLKVGQYPSIADLHISKVKNYDKVLPKEKIREMTKAIGLAANGVGIGSFVYLRRIFEHLIDEAHSLGSKEDGWDEQIYLKSKMDKKIEILKNYLPAFLVANRSMYGMLSTGIHELDEQQCLKYFEAIKIGIELILDEKVEQLSKKNKILEANKMLSTILQEIKK